MDGLDKAEREKLKASRDSMLAGADIGSVQNTCYSPRLALISRIDEATDKALQKVSNLRDLRRRVENESDYTANTLMLAAEIL